MLLPFFIRTPNFKKPLDNSDKFTIRKNLIERIWNIVDGTIAQFSCLQIAATSTEIFYLEHGQQKLNKPSNHQYGYIFACNQQKRPEWFQNMTPADKEKLLEQLKSDYRHILIDYFITEKTLKERIDKFINALFYANISVPQIIEMHMELIDEFSKHLKLEGRSDETLLDYRLTLIDILANLCELYRSSRTKIN